MSTISWDQIMLKDNIKKAKEAAAKFKERQLKKSSSVDSNLDLSYKYHNINPICGIDNYILKNFSDMNIFLKDLNEIKLNKANTSNDFISNYFSNLLLMYKKLNECENKVILRKDIISLCLILIRFINIEISKEIIFQIINLLNSFIYTEEIIANLSNSFIHFDIDKLKSLILEILVQKFDDYKEEYYEYLQFHNFLIKNKTRLFRYIDNSYLNQGNNGKESDYTDNDLVQDFHLIKIKLNMHSKLEIIKNYNCLYDIIYLIFNKEENITTKFEYLDFKNLYPDYILHLYVRNRENLKLALCNEFNSENVNSCFFANIFTSTSLQERLIYKTNSDYNLSLWAKLHLFIIIKLMNFNTDNEIEKIIYYIIQAMRRGSIDNFIDLSNYIIYSSDKYYNYLHETQFETLCSLLRSSNNNINDEFSNYILSFVFHNLNKQIIYNNFYLIKDESIEIIFNFFFFNKRFKDATYLLFYFDIYYFNYYKGKISNTIIQIIMKNFYLPMVGISGNSKQNPDYSFDNSNNNIQNIFNVMLSLNPAFLNSNFYIDSDELTIKYSFLPSRRLLINLMHLEYLLSNDVNKGNHNFLSSLKQILQCDSNNEFWFSFYNFPPFLIPSLLKTLIEVFKKNNNSNNFKSEIEAFSNNVVNTFCFISKNYQAELDLYNFYGFIDNQNLYSEDIFKDKIRDYAYQLKKLI